MTTTTTTNVWLPLHQIEEREFRLAVEGRTVPAVAWWPAGKTACPLVLIGHGGSGHKRSTLVLGAVQRLVGCHGLAVAAIDGPVHGDRRARFEAGPAVRDEFRVAWTRGDTVDPMVADWRATLDTLAGWPQIDVKTIGWYGISMGTAYGLSLIAAEPRIRAAVLGMWGSCRPAGAERLRADAARVRVPVLFQRQREDPIFTAAGQQDLYDRIAIADKQLSDHPGAHQDPSDTQLDETIDFLIARLFGETTSAA